MKHKKQLVFLEPVHPETDADEALIRLVKVLQDIGITIIDITINIRIDIAKT